MSELAWHFVGDTLRDGSPIPPDGGWLEHAGPVVICVSGLHASKDPFDAWQYAPGPVLCLVEVDGVEGRQHDKLVCRRRRIIERHDISDTVRLFARQCALDVIDLWRAPSVVRRYLMTGDESIREAAWKASRNVRVAARDAAWSASWAAATAARDAARAAAYASRETPDSTWCAGRDTAWAARVAAGGGRDARRYQCTRFNRLVTPLFRALEGK